MPAEPTSDAPDVVIVDDVPAPKPDDINGASTSTTPKPTETATPSSQIDVDLTENDDSEKVDIAIDLTDEVPPIVGGVEITAIVSEPALMETASIIVDSAPDVSNQEVCSQYIETCVCVSI